MCLFGCEEMTIMTCSQDCFEAEQQWMQFIFVRQNTPDGFFHSLFDFIQKPATKTNLFLLDCHKLLGRIFGQTSEEQNQKSLWQSLIR